MGVRGVGGGRAVRGEGAVASARTSCFIDGSWRAAASTSATSSRMD